MAPDTSHLMCSSCECQENKRVLAGVRRTYDVVPGWNSHRVTRIVGQYLDVFFSVAKVTCVPVIYSIDQGDQLLHILMRNAFKLFASLMQPFNCPLWPK